MCIRDSHTHDPPPRCVTFTRWCVAGETITHTLIIDHHGTAEDVFTLAHAEQIELADGIGQAARDALRQDTSSETGHGGGDHG